MPPRKKIGDLLATPATPPVIRRGQGFTLSTEEDAQAPSGESAHAPESDSAQEPEPPTAIEPVSAIAQEPDSPSASGRRRTSAQKPKSESAQAPPEPVAVIEPIRSSRGLRIRTDLLKSCRLLAVQTDRKLYEVVEEALSQYLDRQDDGAHGRKR